MSVYKDSEQMLEALGGLWQQLLDDSLNGEKFKQAGLIVKYEIFQPDGLLWVTPQGVFCGEQDFKVDVQMTLSGDTCHAFWLKELTLPAALARRLIISKGAMNKVLKLLPLLGPLYELYPDVCEQYGLPH